MARWIAAALVLVLWAGNPVAPVLAEGENILGQDAVKEFRALAKAHQYRKLRKWLATIEPKLAGRSAELRAEFVALKEDLARSRERWLTDRVSKQLFEEVQSGIRLKVANVKLGASTILDWAQTRLEKEALARIAKGMKTHDAVSVEEVRAAWTRRKKGEWRELTIPRGMTSASIRASQNWWRNASLAERRERELLAFVASEGLFDIRGKERWSDCPSCNGTGLQSKRYKNGATLRHVCANCGGSSGFAILGFR